MKEKGFTLIELLGVVVLLGVIGLIVVPVVNGIIKDNKEKVYNEQINRIVEASKKWGLENTDKLNETRTAYIGLDELISGGFLTNSEIKDPRDESVLTGCVTVNYLSSYNQYNYVYSDECPPSYNLGEQKVYLVETGDGLYLDEDGVYRYKGSNPDNYILLGTEEYRILAIEPQGIKVIRSSNVTDSAFDIGGVTASSCTDETCPRYNSNNTYCQKTSGTYYGCNIWTSASEILQNGTSSTTITNGSVSGTVIDNSTAYTYLHDTYYSNLSSVQQYIVEDATWNVGPVTMSSPMLLDTVKDEENNWTWSGKIGLMTYSEYIQAQSLSSSGYASCSSNVSNSKCGTDNWLNLGVATWTMNPYIDPYLAWCVINSGYVGSTYAYYTRGLRPVVVLNSNIKLSGSGTPGSPFEIIS